MLANRIWAFPGEDDESVEKRMFGGLAFIWKGHRLAGVVGSDRVGRVGNDNDADARSRSQVHAMNFTGRPMSGFVLVDPVGVSGEDELRFWIERCRAFVSGLPARNDQ